MSEQNKGKSVLGKRQREQPNKKAQSTQLPDIVEYSTGSSSEESADYKPAKKSRNTRLSSKSGESSPAVGGGDRDRVSERTKRAQRRASLNVSTGMLHQLSKLLTWI